MDKPYEYQVSLRIRHPTVPTVDISSALALTPRTSWTAGDAWGPGQSARRESSYWSAVLEGESTLPLPEFLELASRNLEAHADFLQRIVNTGGRVEYFVGWFLNRDSGDVFPASLLQRLGALGIDLSIDLYGPARDKESPS